MEKVRLNKKKCQQGLDGIKAEYVLEIAGTEHLYCPPEELKNAEGHKIVSIECVGGKLKVYINPVHSVRSNNVKSFGIADAIKLELVRGQVVEFIKNYVYKNVRGEVSEGFIEQVRVKSLECNITLPCVDGASPSDVIALFDLAFDRTVVFRKQREKTKYQKTNTGCLYSKPKEYKLKIYDKTEEQHSKGTPLVEKNLLRIEVVFIDRSLRRMYGKKRGLMDVLSAQGIEVACQEYKKVLEKEIINQSVIPCLNYCVRQLLKSLQSAEAGHEISAAIAQCKELIPDIEVLRKALKRWYEWRGIRYCIGRGRSCPLLVVPACG